MNNRRGSLKRDPMPFWRHLVSGTACAALLLAPVMVQAQPAPAVADQAPPAATDQQGYTQDQLQSLLAPIALYPDQLLTQILMASAYPQDVQAADAWVKVPANRVLSGTALQNAVASEAWDPSVKSLVPFPRVLDNMVSDPSWMQQIGYAMSVQQPAVMQAVQTLRQEAQREGHLQSTPQQVVAVDRGYITIAPADPAVVYVPFYDPEVVYGVWAYPIAPVFFPVPAGYVVGPYLDFGVGFGIVAGLWGWGYPVWWSGGFFVDGGRWNVISAGHGVWGGGMWHPAVAVGRPGFGFRGGAAMHASARAGAEMHAGAHGGADMHGGGRPAFHAPSFGPHGATASAGHAGEAGSHAGTAGHGATAASHGSSAVHQAAAHTSAHPGTTHATTHSGMTHAAPSSHASARSEPSAPHATAPQRPAASSFGRSPMASSPARSAMGGGGSRPATNASFARSSGGGGGHSGGGAHHK
jgi:hypothetical protein